MSKDSTSKSTTSNPLNVEIFEHWKTLKNVITCKKKVKKLLAVQMKSNFTFIQLYVEKMYIEIINFYKHKKYVEEKNLKISM
jgi:hypothetical protein